MYLLVTEKHMKLCDDNIKIYCLCISDPIEHVWGLEYMSDHLIRLVNSLESLYNLHEVYHW